MGNRRLRARRHGGAALDLPHARRPGADRQVHARGAGDAAAGGRVGFYARPGAKGYLRIWEKPEEERGALQRAAGEVAAVVG